MTSPKQTLLFTENQLTSSAVDSLARPSQQQDQEKAQRTPDTFGRKCLGLYEKFAPDGSWERTFMDLLIGTGDWFSTRCALTWKMKASKSSRLFCQLQASTHRTKGTESSLLLTPGLVNIEESPQKYMERQRKRTEAGMNKAPHPGNKYNCLLSQVLYSGMLPTPRVKGHGNSHQRIAEGRVDDLTTMAKMNMLPTPTATDWKGAYPPTSINKFPARKNMMRNVYQHIEENYNSKTSQLNPRFVAEMMGFPPNWTQLPFQSGETNP